MTKVLWKIPTYIQGPSLVVIGVQAMPISSQRDAKTEIFECSTFLGKAGRGLNMFSRAISKGFSMLTGESCSNDHNSYLNITESSCVG